MDCKNEHPLGRIIYHTALKMSKYAEKILAPMDITVEQLHTLKHLIEESGVTQRQLADLTDKTAANTTRILDRLESKNFIERQPDPNDRRATLIFITKDGSKMVDKVEATFESTTDIFLDGVSPEEEATVRKTLEKIQNNLIKLTDKAELS